MVKICLEAEKCVNYAEVFKKASENSPLLMNLPESLACSAMQISNSAKVAMILVLSNVGDTAKLVAKYRPNIMILLVTL